MKKLTGLPINYLITVNFHGFKQIVDQLGGVWMDIDRRYYNRNTGAGYNDFADINLQPGYQRLNGGAARSSSSASGTPTPTSTGSRASRQFVRAFKQQVAQHFDPFEPPEDRLRRHPERRGRRRRRTSTAGR